MADYEGVAGVDRMDDMAGMIEQAAADAAHGWSLYGPGGTWDAHRKALLSVIACEIRDGAKEQGVKITEAEIEQRAHAAKRYLDFLDEHTLARAEYIVRDTKLTSLNQRVSRGNRVLDFAARIG